MNSSIHARDYGNSLICIQLKMTAIHTQEAYFGVRKVLTNRANIPKIRPSVLKTVT